MYYILKLNNRKNMIMIIVAVVLVSISLSVGSYFYFVESDKQIRNTATENYFGWKLSTNDRCGPEFGNTACSGKQCCSSKGYCGGSGPVRGQLAKDEWCSSSFPVNYMFNAEKPPDESNEYVKERAKLWGLSANVG